MIDKINTLFHLKELKIIAVIRGKTAKEAEKTTEACINGGINAIEIAFTTPQADKAIANLNQKYSQNKSVIIGAGTVLDEVTARIAIINGANFIVSATFDENVARICNLYGVLYIPGCFTPNEVQRALSMGAYYIKVFPGSVSGSSIANELNGPFPQAHFMITGGVNLKNIKGWFNHGASLVGIGSQLVGPGSIGEFEQVTKNAEKFVKQIYN